jgi:hypothetical protein
MADDNYRAHRSRAPLTHDDVDPVAQEALRDPLAELARLIGQGDPVGEYDRSARLAPAQSPNDVPPPATADEWAPDDGYAEPNQHTEESYAQTRLADPYPPDRSYSPDDRDDGRAPPTASQYPAPTQNFGDARDDEATHDTQYRDEDAPTASAHRRLPSLAPQNYEDDYENDDQWQDDAGGQSYEEDEYDDELRGNPQRRGLVVIMAVLGLVIVGVASAFAYRTMFGRAILPSLPPIIRASDGPNKIVPAQAAASNPASAANPGSGEKLVSREEQPVRVQPADAAPRVISTIPVSPAPSPAPATAVPPNPASPAPAAAAVPPPAPAAAPASPPTQAVAPATTPAASTEPKKVHTVIIRPDQQSAASVPAAAPPPPARPKATPPPVAKPSPALAPKAAANAPLALIPAARGELPPVEPPRTQVAREQPPVEPPRTQVAREQPSNAPLATMPATAPAPAAAPAAAGAYTVQVSSQHSEAEAQAAFRSLRAKFPQQLGNREPIIRRVELGDKGTFYRALVGPFASVEQAAGMCSNLKAAGGTCLVQRD